MTARIQLNTFANRVVLTAATARQDLENIQRLALGAKNADEMQNGGYGRIGMDEQGRVYKFSTKAYERRIMPTTDTMREDCQRLREHMVRLAEAILPEAEGARFAALPDGNGQEDALTRDDVIRDIRRQLGLTEGAPSPERPLLDRRVVTAALKTINAAITDHNSARNHGREGRWDYVDADTESIVGYYDHKTDIRPEAIAQRRAAREAAMAKAAAAAPKPVMAADVREPNFDMEICTLRNLFDQKNDGSFKTPVGSTRGHVKLSSDNSRLVSVGKSIFSRADSTPNKPAQNVAVRLGVYKALEGAGASPRLLDEAKTKLFLPTDDKAECYPPEAGAPLERSVLKGLLDGLDRERMVAFDMLDVEEGVLQFSGGSRSDRLGALEAKLNALTSDTKAAACNVVLKRDRGTNTYSLEVAKDDPGTAKANVFAKLEFLEMLNDLDVPDEISQRAARFLGFVYDGTRRYRPDSSRPKVLQAPLNALGARRLIARFRNPPKAPEKAKNVAREEAPRDENELLRRQMRSGDFERLASEIKKIKFHDGRGRLVANPFRTVDAEDLNDMKPLANAYDRVRDSEAGRRQFQTDVIKVFTSIVRDNPGMNFVDVSNLLNEHFARQ